MVFIVFLAILVITRKKYFAKLEISYYVPEPWVISGGERKHSGVNSHHFIDSNRKYKNFSISSW